MSYELKIRQSFAKLRQILGSNYAGKGRIKSVRKRDPFIGEEGGAAAHRRNSPPLHFPLHGGNPLFMVVTPSST
jgi:hypothetical protein